MNPNLRSAFCVLIFAVGASQPAFASVKSSLDNVQGALFSTVLPVCAMLSVGWSAFSFFTGNPNAKQYLAYSILGAALIFGAQSLISLIEQLVR